MTKEKQLYVSPETETLVIRFEGVILTVSGDGEPNPWTPGNTNWFNDEG